MRAARSISLVGVLFALACGAPRQDLEVRWTFAGKNCAQAGVATIQVAIAGELLTPDTFSCAASGGGVTTGVSLGRFILGTYQLTVLGLDASGAVRFRASQQIQVRSGGPNLVSVDLQPGRPTTGSASLRWSFAGGMTCAEAKVDRVRVAFDPTNADGSGGLDAGEVACGTGGVEGAEVVDVPPGNHSFAIAAVRGTALVYQSVRSDPASFQVGLNTLLQIDAPAVSPRRGGADLAWSFPASVNCTSTSQPPNTVNYRLTPPGGQPLALAQATCGGIVFCNPGSAGCPLSEPGLVPGLWGLDASAQIVGKSYVARVLFGVPNAETGAYTIAFKAQ